MANQQQVVPPLVPPNAQPNVQPNNAPPIIQPNVQPNALAQPNAQQNAVNRIQVRVPPFWKQNPEIWFHQLEAQFANSLIVNDRTKFNTIVGVIESDILSSVSDIVLNPPANNCYDAIKARLLNQFAETENKKLNNLFHELTIGDMKPSDLLRKMRELSCGKVGDDLMKTLWLQRLPATIQTVLSTSNDNLIQLAVMADKMFDITEASSIQAVSSFSQQQHIDDLVNVVHKLDVKIENLNKDFRESRTSFGHSSRSRQQTPHRASSAPNNEICFYHNRYGNKAVKCRTPCTFLNSKQENSNAGQALRHLAKAQR